MSGLATGLGGIYSEKENIWIGWPGSDDTPEEQHQIKEILESKKMYPVFLSPKEIEDFYEGFSNETLWPAFHYFPQYISYEDAFWEAYVRVNEKFCSSILEQAGPGDTIWVHDYHLLLLPQLLKQKIPHATIAFFQHIPFPSYEIFRLLPWREEILKGMCGSDLVGFHTFDDMRHFMSAVNRILGFSNESGYIRAENHLIHVDSFPMGIDYRKFEEAASSPEVQKIKSRYKNSLGSQKLLLSIDRLDYSKGILQRLWAFQLFLEENPEYKEKVSLIMVLVPSREQVKEYRQLKEEIDTVVGNINSNFSTFTWVPVHYFYRSFSFKELSAFYSMADIALVTPLRDGMNLVCKEFVASKTDQSGVLILSEMAGASKELYEAILVNPNDIQTVSLAIKDALQMEPAKQRESMAAMQQILYRFDIFQWVKVFMDRLDLVKRKQQELQSRHIDERRGILIQRKFLSAKKPVILLDYDGTLVSYNNKPEQAVPDGDLQYIMQQLSQKALVVIISGRDKNTLWKWFHHLPVNLMAEHGLWVLRKDKGEDWVSLIELEGGWKPDIWKIMEYYVRRTPGTFVEEKDNSLVWHYRQAEKGLGDLRMREMISHVKYIAQGNNLQIMEGNKFLEIKKPDINKSKAAIEFINMEGFDFILAIGDHWSDEETFKSLPRRSFSIRVGYEFTHAKYNVQTFREVKKLLLKLVEKENSQMIST